MKNKEITIDKNGVKEKYLAFYYDGEYETFKNIFERCAPRIRLFMPGRGESSNIEKDVLYYDDGRYEFTSREIFYIWNSDNSEDAFLKLSKTNCSYFWAQCNDVSKHYSCYLPFPYIIDPKNDVIAFDSVCDGDYLLIKVMEDYNKDKGKLFSCNGLFIDEVGIDIE